MTYLTNMIRLHEHDINKLIEGFKFLKLKYDKLNETEKKQIDELEEKYSMFFVE